MLSQKNKYRLIILILMVATGGGVALFYACSSPYTVAGTRWNLGSIYNPSSSNIHPAFKVYHNSDNTSLLLVKLFPSELLFNQANTAGQFISKVSVQVRTYEVENDNKLKLTDSITYYYTIKQENVGRRFLAQVPLKTEMGKRYQLRVVTRDQLRHDFNLRYIDVDKTSKFSEQNFNVTTKNNIPYFSNVLTPNSIYKIQYRDPSYKYIYIDYYKEEAPLPRPAFAPGSDASIYQKPDSMYMLDYSPDLLMEFQYTGVYHFRFDTTQPDGLTIVNFGKDFPKIKTPAEMIDPLAYITTTADYKDLKLHENNKLTVDNFWLNIGKSTGRARELIRIYYNRVYFANYYFSNDRPGWKTDRGMIYIVYGPPQNMKKSPAGETWVYYLKGPNNSIQFNFSFKPTAFALDNFVLQRDNTQDWHWRDAVDSWRNGQIYLSD